MDLLGFVLVFVTACIIALVGETLTPGEVPFRWPIAILIGIMGGTVGTALLGGWGPALAGVYMVPATLGATVFVALFDLTLSAFAQRPSPR